MADLLGLDPRIVVIVSPVLISWILVLLLLDGLDNPN